MSWECTADVLGPRLCSCPEHGGINWTRDDEDVEGDDE